MAVELHILSGSLQGQCLGFDGHRVAIGSDETADVRFDPDQEPGSRGKCAVLTLDEETGWQISNQGSGVWLVNQTPLAAGASQRLRSEDLVRVSEMGPEFYFRLVARPRGFANPSAQRAVREAEFARPPALDRETQSPADVQPAVITEYIDEPVPDSLPTPAAACEDVANDAGLDLPGPRGNDNPLQESKQSDPDLSGAGPKAMPAPRPRRKRRESSPLARFVGVVISGLLGLACAYGLACLFGAAHFFRR